MKIHLFKFIVVSMVLTLLISFVSTSASVEATSELKVDNLTSKKIEALGSSVYFTDEGFIEIDKEQALSYYDFSKKELEDIESQLSNISKERVDELKEIAMSEQKPDDVKPAVAPAIIWVGAGVIGALTGAAIYFTAKYMNWKEKKYLVDQCYNEGGTPILDTGDTAGVGGAPKKAWWKIGNTYKFECAK